MAMRLSSLLGDRGYRADAGRWGLSFNGDPVPPGWMVVTADEEEGVLRYFMLEDDGEVFAEGGRDKLFEARGRVQIIPPEDDAAADDELAELSSLLGVLVAVPRH
jgi:hypothetical protein